MSLFFFIILLIGVALFASLLVCAAIVLRARRGGFSDRRLLGIPGAGLGGAAGDDGFQVAGRSVHTVARGGGKVRTAHPTSTTLRRECAWCGGFLGGDPASPQITHGICLPCRERTLAQAGLRIIPRSTQTATSA